MAYIGTILIAALGLIICQSNDVSALISFSNYTLQKAIQCCDNGENKMINSTCVGNFTTKLDCPNGKYIVDPSDDIKDEWIINEEGHLIDENHNMFVGFANRYCITERDGMYIALVCFPLRDEYEEMTYLGNVICASISIICLLLTFIVYCIVKDLRDLQGKCMMNMIFNQAIGFIILCIIQTNTNLPNFWCEAFAFIMYAAMLATFLWLNVLSFNVWRSVKFSDSRPSKKLLLIYCLYAYGLTALTVVITLILHHVQGDHLMPNFGLMRCWFSGRAELLAFFYGPVAFLLLANLFFYIATILVLWNDYKKFQMAPEAEIKSHRYKCLLYFKLFIIMGISWIFEPLSFLATPDDHAQAVFWTITDYINILQGVLIFILLVATRRRALRGLARSSICGFRAGPAYFATLQPDDECEDILDPNNEEGTLSEAPHNAEVK